MGLLKFKLPSTSWSVEDLRQAYVLGPDGTPMPGDVAIRGSELHIRRVNNESGRVVVPWRIEGFGRLMLNTATLPERMQPYDLVVELARGTLNDLQNQLVIWQNEIQISNELRALMSRARNHFARAATSRDEPLVSQEESARALRDGVLAGRQLAETYSAQLLERRRDEGPAFKTRLAIELGSTSRPQPWWTYIPDAFTAARVDMSWRTIAAESGQYRWEVPDAQIHWCRKHRIKPSAGPLIDLRPGALPDWLWLWQGDYEEIHTQAVDFVRHALSRYRGKVATWHLVARPASEPILDLSEEQQVRLTARLIQVARTVDPDAQLIVDFDRPWRDWMVRSNFQLGSLHLADALARADLGLSGVGLEIVPGFEPWGSPRRELLDFSRLLDLYYKIDLPLHLSIALPSHIADSPGRDAAQLDLRQWPATPTPELQRDLAARWIALAFVKPYVSSICWLEASDMSPRLYPGCGLFRLDHGRQPAFDWLTGFRRRFLP